MASGLPTAFRHIKDNQKPLRFNSNGKFRILHLTDIHEVDPAMDDDEDHRPCSYIPHIRMRTRRQAHYS